MPSAALRPHKMSRLPSYRTKPIWTVRQSPCTKLIVCLGQGDQRAREVALSDIDLCKDIAECSALCTRSVEVHSRPTPSWIPPAVLPSLKLQARPGTRTRSRTCTRADSCARTQTGTRAPLRPRARARTGTEPAPSASAPPPTPAPQAAPQPPAKKNNIRSVLIIGATFVSAVILIILMIVFALQAG